MGIKFVAWCKAILTAMESKAALHNITVSFEIVASNIQSAAKANTETEALYSNLMQRLNKIRGQAPVLAPLSAHVPMHAAVAAPTAEPAPGAPLPISLDGALSAGSA